MSRPMMLVEDDDDVRTLLAELLEHDGQNIQCTKNGADALASLRALTTLPAIMLVDLSLPVMSGTALVSAMRERPDWANIPVFFLSASADLEAQAVALGVHGWLRKPVDIDELLALVRRFT